MNSNKKILIGLSGEMSSGKDTLANYIKIKYPNTIIRAMSYPLKKALQEIFHFSDDQMYDEECKKIPDTRWFNCTPRKTLQYVGTDLLRDNLDKIMPGLEKNVFVHSFKLWYKNIVNENGVIIVIVPDIRFMNEVDMIHELDGKVIRIIRENKIKNDNHISETELSKVTNYDYIINNNVEGDLNNLFYQFDKICDEIIKK